jgi:hypothetical protein
MISYELARQLKNAGFPEEGYLGARYFSFVAHPRVGMRAQYAITTQVAGKAQFDKIGDDYARIPRLEELREACGDDIEALIHQTGERVAACFNAWSGSEPTTRNIRLLPTRCAASVQNELRNNDLFLRDYGHLKYKRLYYPRPEPLNPA